MAMGGTRVLKIIYISDRNDICIYRKQQEGGQRGWRVTTYHHSGMRPAIRNVTQPLMRLSD